MFVFRQDALTDSAAVFYCCPFNKHRHHFTEFGIGPFGNHERKGDVRAQLLLDGLHLNLDASRANHVVATTENAEGGIGLRVLHLRQIMGDECFVAEMRRTDDEASFLIQRNADTRQRRIPL